MGRLRNIDTGEIFTETSHNNWGYSHFKTMNVHKIIYETFKGKVPKGLQIDHIDNNKTNNKLKNLRMVTATENNFNRMKAKNATSKYKGVLWCKKRKKWICRVAYNYNKIYIGAFIDEEEAAKNYNYYIKKYLPKNILITLNDVTPLFPDKPYIKKVIKKRKQYKKIKPSKIIYQYDFNGNFIREWKSVSELIKAGIATNTVRNVLNKNRPSKSHLGYIWKYAEDVNYDKSNIVPYRRKRKTKTKRK